MTEPTPTYTAAALRTAFATAVDGVVRVPAGTYELDYPLRIPRPYGVVTGEGPRSSVLRAAPDVYTPLLVSLPADADVSPVAPAGLAYDAPGWFSLSDFSANFAGYPSFTLDLTVALPSALPPGEWALAACRGQLLHGGPVDTPFLLTVSPDGTLRYTLATTEKAWRYETAAGAAALGESARYVCQLGGGAVRVWVVRSSGPTLAIDQPHPGLTAFPVHTDMVVGRVPDRFPEGAGWLSPAPGTVYRAVEAKAFATHSPADPPTNPLTQDTSLGVFTRFDAPDGAFFLGTCAGKRAVFMWRRVESDLPGHGAWVSGLGLFGGTAGLVLSNQHNWSVRDVHAGDGGRYGIVAQQQCYGGALDAVNVGAVGGVGIALLNNSALVSLRDCHAEACGGFGVLASDADQLNIDGGWFDNNGVNLLVKGDNAAVSATGAAFGNEGSSTRANVVLSNCSSASFAGCAFTPLAGPMPAVEFSGCSGVVFVAPRFGMHPAAESVLKITAHDAAKPVRVVGEGRRWAGAADAVPLVPVPPPTNVIVS